MSELLIYRPGQLKAFGKIMDATCNVRNELNGLRQNKDIVKTKDQYPIPNGTPYFPRQFPEGIHLITNVLKCGESTEFWPYFIDTAAEQELTIWKYDAKTGEYIPTANVFTGRGYGIHHARWHHPQLGLTPSSTTLGCINILDPEAALWLGKTAFAAHKERTPMFIDVKHTGGFSHADPSVFFTE